MNLSESFKHQKISKEQLWFSSHKHRNNINSREQHTEILTHINSTKKKRKSHSTHFLVALHRQRLTWERGVKDL